MDVPSPGNCAFTVYEIQGQLSSEVFGNDLLRRIIFKYALQSSGKICIQTVKTLRLVQKSWLETVSDIFRRARHPLFNIISNNQTPDGLTNYSTTLEQFVLSPFFKGAPYNISLLPHFFTPQNYNNFSACLINFGHSTLSLNITFPHSSAMSLIFPPIHLPQLQKITVQFSDLTANGIHPGTCGYTYAISFLQTIFRATEKLTEIRLKNNTPPTEVPLGFECLIAPETVRNLFLDCPLKSSELKILLRSHLPNLSSLSLFATDQPFSNGLINDILAKYKGQLVSLFLRGQPYQERVRTKTWFRFPHMSKLQSLTVTSTRWELEENLSNLQENLPKVKQMTLLNTLATTFKTWTDTSSYPTVETLFITITKPDNGAMVNQQYVEVPCTLGYGRTRALRLAFANVVNLEIALAGHNSDVGSVRYIFSEMPLLEKLGIRLNGNGTSAQLLLNWDSAFVALPSNLIAKILSLCNRMPEFNQFHKFAIAGLPSIRSLTNLKSLALVETFYPAVPGPPLITKMTFHLAFLRMPNLRHLLLHGRFWPTEDVHNLWRREKNEDIQSLQLG